VILIYFSLFKINNINHSWLLLGIAGVPILFS
jgi:hypothetical protein